MLLYDIVQLYNIYSLCHKFILQTYIHMYLTTYLKIILRAKHAMDAYQITIKL